MSKALASRTSHRSSSSSSLAAQAVRTKRRHAPAQAEQGREQERAQQQEYLARVYVWGSNHNGQVSTRLPTRPCTTPHAVTELDATERSVRKAIVSVACGYHATFVISVGGTVYSWGKGPIGRKGSSNKITRVAGLPAIRQIAVSAEHAIACAADGSVFSWGKGKSGRLGHGNAGSVATPRVVEALGNETCVAVAVGDQHSMVLTAAGDIFAFGSAKAGQLGHGTTLDSMLPVLVPRADASNPWSAIACGANHSVACTSGGKLYGWGWSSDGRLGFNPGDDENEGSIVCQPRRVLLPPGVDIRSVGCGHAHTLCVSTRGKLFAFGWNVHGQCGIDARQHENVLSPTEVPLAEHVVASAHGGFAHSMVITQQRQLLCWGFGLEGQLGAGTEESSHTPTLLSLDARGGQVLSVSPGHCHSAAIVSTASLETLITLHQAHNMQRKTAARTIAQFIDRRWSSILLQRKLAAEMAAKVPPIEPPQAPAPRGMLIDDGDAPDDSKFFVTKLADAI